MNKWLISSKIDWITQNVSESVVHWWGKMREITTTDIRIEPGAPINYRMNSRLAFGDKIISINELFSPSYHMQAASFSLRVISPLVSYLLATFLLNLVFRRFFFLWFQWNSNTICWLLIHERYCHWFGVNICRHRFDVMHNFLLVYRSNIFNVIFE